MAKLLELHRSWGGLEWQGRLEKWKEEGRKCKWLWEGKIYGMKEIVVNWWWRGRACKSPSGTEFVSRLCRQENLVILPLGVLNLRITLFPFHYYKQIKNKKKSSLKKKTQKTKNFVLTIIAWYCAIAFTITESNNTHHFFELFFVYKYEVNTKKYQWEFIFIIWYLPLISCFEEKHHMARVKRTDGLPWTLWQTQEALRKALGKRLNLVSC